MTTRPEHTPDPATSTSPGAPRTPDGAGAAAHDPLAPPPRPTPGLARPTPGLARPTRRHPAALAGLAAAALALLTVLIAGLVRGSGDTISASVIGLLVMISWATTPWALAHSHADLSTTKEHSRA